MKQIEMTQSNLPDWDDVNTIPPPWEFKEIKPTCEEQSDNKVPENVKVTQKPIEIKIMFNELGELHPQFNGT